MVSLFDLHVGQLMEFNRVLSAAGFTGEDALRINRSPELARKMREVLEPQRFVAPLPSWYVSPEQQLERARQLWPGMDLPEPPKEYELLSAAEVLLLHVPDTFDGLWDKVEAPAGFAKKLSSDLKPDRRNLRMTPGKALHSRPSWLAFNTEYGAGVAPSHLWPKATDLAGPEVLSALIQFPNWCLSWLRASGSQLRHIGADPNLSGYQMIHQGRWDYVPRICLSVPERSLWLVPIHADGTAFGHNTVSPTVRS